MTHPKLTAAIASSDTKALLGIAMRAWFAAKDGRRCECAEPELTGFDLMCGACLLENKDQERKRVDQLVNAHEFEPGKLGGRMCAVCTMPERAPRHNGVNEVGRCSWGERRLAGEVV